MVAISGNKSSEGEFKVWRGKLPLEHRYTSGVAGQRFFGSLKNLGVLIASRCSKCDVSYIPPRPYCESCYEAIDSWVDVKNSGSLYSHTLEFETRKGRTLKTPIVFGLIRFEGVRGGLVHRIFAVDPKKLTFGMKMEPKLKPKNQRTGSINDILFFRPVV